MALDTVAARLKWARERHGHYKTPTDAARAFGWPISTYLGHENSDRTPSRPTAKKYAKAYRIRWEWLLESEGQPALRHAGITVEGQIGAGAEYIPFDDSDVGFDPAPAAVDPNSAAAVVKGDSMYPRYFEGEYVYFLKERRSPTELLGAECVMKLADGRVFLKIIRPGSHKGLFNLESWNAPTLEDQEVEWASRVTWRRR